MFVDADMMISAFMNLLSNAIKFSPTGSCITITGQKFDKDFYEIRISDQGVGIDEEKVNEKLLQGSYYSTKGTNGESGTGLGLLIVKSAVERNDGTIRAFNNTDAGATFAIKLPLFKEK